ncbi:MAG: methyltransferase domain-containing protein, partial [Bryobacteraceae bacterium]
FNQKLQSTKSRAPLEEAAWYPYDSLGNFFHLDRLLRGPRRDLTTLIGSQPVLDFGCADGDLAFFLESIGCRVRAFDSAPTNYNGMVGVATLKSALRSSIEINEIDLDTQFELKGTYGVAFLLGILYHLKNPFFVLEKLSKHARYCLLSTRVAQRTPDLRMDVEAYPIAYLVDPVETNNDDTNFWIFSDAGLRRLIARTGWQICDYLRIGNTSDSDPVSWQGDERVFCLLRSYAPELGPFAREDDDPIELLSGWYGLEPAGHRWTERRFAVGVRAAAGHAELRLHYAVTDQLFAHTGAVVLTARTGGRALPGQRSAKPGNFIYTVELSGPATVHFELDKAIPAGAIEERELGVAVASVELI